MSIAFLSRWFLTRAKIHQRSFQQLKTLSMAQKWPTCAQGLPCAPSKAELNDFGISSSKNEGRHDKSPPARCTPWCGWPLPSWSCPNWTSWAFHNFTSRNNNRSGTSSNSHPNNDAGSCSVKTTDHFDWRPTTKEKTEISFGSRIHYSSCVSSHHLRNHTCGLQLGWLWWSLMMMQHPKPHPHTIIQLSTSVGLPHYTIHHHHYHTTRHFHATGSHTKSHHSNSPTYRNFSTSKWHNIPALVGHWWSRAGQSQEWHQISSFVEDDQRSTSSWSSGMQAEMGNLETNGPTWSRSPASHEPEAED